MPEDASSSKQEDTKTAVLDATLLRHSSIASSRLHRSRAQPGYQTMTSAIGPCQPPPSLSSLNASDSPFITIMSVQKALLLVEKQGNYEMGTRPIPKPGKDEILVKVKAAAINPADLWIQKFGYLITEYPAVLGLDFAGEVVELGEGVTRFKLGDRVLLTGEFESDYSGFQQYAISDVNTSCLIPDSISFEEAASLPTALATAYLGLYNEPPSGLGLKSFLAPGEGAYNGQAIFVTAGSGSVGQVVLQMAKLSGFSYIVTTASPHNAEYVKSLGATHVLDRRLSVDALLEELKKIDGLPKFEYAYDAFGRPDSSLLQAMSVLAPNGKAVTVSPRVQFELKDGKTLSKFSAEKKIPENQPHLHLLFREATRLLESGLIKPQKVDILPGGLPAVKDGLKRIENGQVSAVKMVVRIDETP
ncbi:hypothetical protein NMY22_g4629 [Coprinellus aureogranulatus]|nr:hypothetical protein NMY22_g4629 [Coprinellus aureogranulatus]